MTLLLILNFVFISLQAFSAQDETIYKEIGEEYLIPYQFKKIWIEDKNLIEAINKNNVVSIKTLNVGSVHFRLDNRLFTLIISPIGTKKTIDTWKKLIIHFVGLKIDYCGINACIYGHLYRLSDYQRLIDLVEKNNSVLIFALTVNEKLKPSLQTYIQEILYSHGVGTVKINFLNPWRIYILKNKFKKQELKTIQSMGLATNDLTQITEIEENIKVSVKIVEISKNFERKSGIRWPDSYQAQVISGFFSVENTFDIALSAAEKSGEAKILAAPNLICRSGKEANFFAGGEFPIKILGLRSKEVMWKKYGIGLKLKPLVDPLGQMSLQLDTEVSTLDRSITVDDIPALHTNKVSSYFDLIASRTIAISGLIKNEVSESSEGVPLLKNIPLLGTLFSSKNFQENKSELVIFVTPDLLR